MTDQLEYSRVIGQLIEAALRAAQQSHYSRSKANTKACPLYLKNTPILHFGGDEIIFYAVQPIF